MHPKTQLENLIKQGFKQEHIAEVTDVSQSTISRILNGEIENPKWDVANRINEMYQQENEKTPVA